MSNRGSDESTLEVDFDERGRLRIKGSKEEGVIIGAVLAATIIVFIVSGFVFGARDYPLVILGAVSLTPITVLAIIKLRQIHERRMKELDALITHRYSLESKNRDNQTET